jgi:CPA1 family monovalent cation:H+ antiporter
MLPTLEILVSLLAVIAVVAVVAKRLRIPLAIPLVLTGVGLALIPGLPAVELAPDLVLLLVLPPIIYFASVAMSWKEFRFNLRPISLLRWARWCSRPLPSPPPAAGRSAFPGRLALCLARSCRRPTRLRRWRSPAACGCRNRLIVVLEGEGLGNDATALIL